MIIDDLTLIKPPPGVQVTELKILRLWWKDDILYGISKDEERSIEDYDPVLKFFQESFEKKGKFSFLVDISRIRPLNKQVRTYIMTELPNYVKAMAIIANSPMGKMIGNILISIRPGPFPSKLFENEETAREWLKQHS